MSAIALTLGSRPKAGTTWGFVIASEAKPISHMPELDCLVASAPRNDVESTKHNPAFSRHNAPEFLK